VLGAFTVEALLYLIPALVKGTGLYFPVYPDSKEDTQQEECKLAHRLSPSRRSTNHGGISFSSF
jgi:hypothetical protein